MVDNKKIVFLERAGTNGDIIKIKFTKRLNPTKSIAYMVAAFNKCFEHGYSRIIVDMENIQNPHTNLIATLIEATSKVRRKNGDIKIINLSEQAKQTMAAFSAYSFLSVESVDV